MVGRTHKELDLTEQYAVKKFFDEERPDAVVLAAAFVGGIMANSLYRADFMMMNMKIQCNVISEAFAHCRRSLLVHIHIVKLRPCTKSKGTDTY